MIMDQLFGKDGFKLSDEAEMEIEAMIDDYKSCFI